MSGYIGTQPVPQATQTRDSFTCTAGQTSFATSGYTPNFLDVYLNGVKLTATDYTASNGSDVVLASGAATGDVLEVVAFTTFDVVTDTITAAGTALTLDRTGSDGTILGLKKDGSTVGSIASGSSGNEFKWYGAFASGAGLGVYSNVSIRPLSNTGAAADGTVSLGHSSQRFKDLYLSGGVYLGGVGSANKLDDYEEGTWTPTVQGTTTAGTSTYTSTREASYVKIGRQVTVTCNLVLTSFSGAVGNAVVTGLPFAAASGFGVATGAFECDNVAFSSGYTTAYVTVFGGQSQVSYRQHGSSRTEAPINVTQVPAGNWQRFSITYFTDD
jgi:hypothetical protein